MNRVTILNRVEKRETFMEHNSLTPFKFIAGHIAIEEQTKMLLKHHYQGDLNDWFSCTNYAFNSVWPIKTKLLFVHTNTATLLKLAPWAPDFHVLPLQLPSNGLPTSTNVLISFPLFEKQSSCVFGARKRMKIWCTCDIIQIYANTILFLLISHQVINFSELDE